MSSWIAGINEKVEETEDILDALETLRATRGGVATDEVKSILGSKAFSYPKPMSLLKGLLGQTTKPGDIVLDFFAGSGTTAQAVLDLNSDDDGQRRYILCSSTEATDKEPEKNLCRDVCAERLRRVSAGYAGRPAFNAEQGGEFAYLQLIKADSADVPFEAKPAEAHTLLSLRLAHTVSTFNNEPVQRIARAGDCDILICVQVAEESIATLADWPAANGVARIAVYSERPESLSEALEGRGVDAACYGLYDALRQGQTRGAA